MSDKREDSDEEFLDSILPKPPQVVYKDPDGSRLSSSERLEEDDRHPVLVFGASQSGKSTLIMALINALEKAGRDGSTSVQLTFGDSFYERRDARAEAQLQMAKNFYQASSNNWMLGRQALPTTQEEIPFFVPLDLMVPDHGRETTRLAIMDGRGEWYEPNRTAEDGVLKDFQTEVLEVLQNYGRGLSIILCAPYSLSDNDRNDVTNCDIGLWHCMQEYLRYRSNPDDDTLGLLLTKWDQKVSPQTSLQRFVQLDGQEIASIFESRFARTWDAFRTADVGGGKWARKAFMQFSSCAYINGRPKIPKEHEHSYLRYPRTLMNWIYGAARRIQFQTGDQQIDFDQILFDDVIEPDAARVEFPEKFLRSIVR